MPKSGKAQDFVKRKQKLGKKKLAPTSTTSTQFKAKSVVLLEQSQYAEERDGQAKSRRALTLSELLTQLRHYSADVRRDAIRGICELLADYPAVLLTHASELLFATTPLVADNSGRVRKALLVLLGTVLEKLESAAALMPHESLLRLHLQAALSHEESAVRTDAVEFLALLLRTRPEALAPAPPLLLPTLVELLGSAAQTAAAAAGGAFPAGSSGAGSCSKGSSGKNGVAAASSGQRPAERQTVVLDVIRALLSAQGFGPAAPDGLTAEEAALPDGAALHAGSGLATCYARWRSEPLPPPAVVALSSVSAAATSSAASSESALRSQLQALPTVLSHCWLELGIWLPATSGDGGALECASSLIALFHQLLSLDPPPSSSNQSQAGSFSSLLLPLLTRHVAPHAPIATPAHGVSQRWQRLNLAICHLLAEASARSAAGDDSLEAADQSAPAAAHTQAAQAAAAALRSRLVGFVCSELGEKRNYGAGEPAAGSAGATARSKPAQELVAACRALLAACARGGAAAERRALLESLLGMWSGAPPMCAVRPPLLALFEETLLPALDGCGASLSRDAAGGLVLAAWAKTVPKLLWQLHDRHPTLSGGLLQALLRLSNARDGSAAAALLDALQPSLEPFFCSRGRSGRPPIAGPFVALPPAVRRLALHLVLRFRPLSAGLLAALARCALGAAAAPATRAAAVELADAVEAAGHCGALSLQSRVSFHATLLVETQPSAEEEEDASQPTLAELRARLRQALQRAEVQHGAVVTQALQRFAAAAARP